jgi:hypothetical protein
LSWERKRGKRGDTAPTWELIVYLRAFVVRAILADHDMLFLLVRGLTDLAILWSDLLLVSEDLGWGAKTRRRWCRCRVGVGWVFVRAGGVRFWENKFLKSLGDSIRETDPGKALQDSVLELERFLWHREGKVGRGEEIDHLVGGPEEIDGPIRDFLCSFDLKFHGLE